MRGKGESKKKGRKTKRSFRSHQLENCDQFNRSILQFKRARESNDSSTRVLNDNYRVNNKKRSVQIIKKAHANNKNSFSPDTRSD